MKRLMMIILLGATITPAFSQVTYLTENQMSYDVLHWHYDKYNNAENDEWYKTTVDGDEYYGVKFTYQEEPIEAIYNAAGEIVSEKKLLSEKDVPKEILSVLDYRIVKYKIKEYLTETTFDKRKPVEVHHRVDARTKTGGQVVIWFDEDFNVIPNRKHHLAFR